MRGKHAPTESASNSAEQIVGKPTPEPLTSTSTPADVNDDDVTDKHFLQANDIFDRVYWIESVRGLFFRLYLSVKKEHQSPAVPFDAVSTNIRNTAKLQAWKLEGELYGLTEEQLVELFWALHRFIQEGLVHEDGSVVINGKEYNLNDLVTSCCSFGWPLISQADL